MMCKRKDKSTLDFNKTNDFFKLLIDLKKRILTGGIHME